MKKSKVYIKPTDRRYKHNTRTKGFYRKKRPVGKAVKGKIVTSKIEQKIHLDKYGHIRKRTVKKIK